MNDGDPPDVPRIPYDRTPFYTLDAEGCPVPCDTPGAWAAWCHQTPDPRRVAVDALEVTLGVGNDPLTIKAVVSTVFLGIDHGFGFGPDPRPVLWETMIFAAPPFPDDHELAGWQERYRDLGAARRGHDAAVLLVRAVLGRHAEAISTLHDDIARLLARTR